MSRVYDHCKYLYSFGAESIPRYRVNIIRASDFPFQKKRVFFVSGNNEFRFIPVSDFTDDIMA